MLVRFIADGTPRDAGINLTAQSPSYWVGETVTVVYSRTNPSDVRTTTEQNQSSLSTTIMIIAFIAGTFLIIGGAGMIRRFHRWRSILRHARWERWYFTQTKRLLSLSRHPNSSAELTVRRVSNSKFAATDLQASSGTLWLARTDGSSRVVLASPNLRVITTGKLR